MATAWQTLEEAALTLGISSRTLHRRLARGEMQSRMENGRREVLVVVDEMEPTAEMLASFEALADAGDVSDVADSASTTATDELPHADEGGQPLSDDVGETMLALHEDRIRRTDLAIMAYQQSVNITAGDARRAHVRSRIAWSVTGGAVVALFIAATWATHTLTKAKADVSHLSATVKQLSDVADTKTREASELRREAEGAKLSAARAEGQLSAARQQIDQLTHNQQAIQAKFVEVATRAAEAIPTTRPVTDVSARVSVTSANVTSATDEGESPLTPATQPAPSPTTAVDPSRR